MKTVSDLMYLMSGVNDGSNIDIDTVINEKVFVFIFRMYAILRAQKTVALLNLTNFVSLLIYFSVLLFSPV